MDAAVTDEEEDIMELPAHEKHRADEKDDDAVTRGGESEWRKVLTMAYA